MSGHFVVWDLKVQDQQQLRNVFGASLTHDIVNSTPHVWNTETSAELQRAMNGATDITREKMPSHGYFHIKNPGKAMCDKARILLDDLAARLVRPEIGLKQLVPNAALAFTRGDNLSAFLDQAQHATATIEYYYAAGSHV
ncbi:MAG: hypothetical protein ACWA5A_11360 [Marinibacterium sp.]